MISLIHLQRFSLLFSLLLFCSVHLDAQSEIFWIGGGGSWDDVTHWSKVSGKVVPAGVIPDESHIVKIDAGSGLNSTSKITIPPGDYAVGDLIISDISGFQLLLDGNSSSNDVKMNIHGDLDITSQVNLAYATSNAFDNQWIFTGAATHNIHTRNLDLQSVVFLTEGATYSLTSHFQASVLLHMYGGTWISNSRIITAGRILFRDDFSPPSTSLTKIFNAGNSTINCDEWDSKFSYGSLQVTGNYTINTAKFEGSPSQNGVTPFLFNNINLLEYPDDPTTGSIVDHYNFICSSCEIANLTIEDTGRTKLADAFTVTGNLTVVNPGVSVEFSAGNGRSNVVHLNGNVFTPKVMGCGPRTIFKSVHTDFTSLIRSSGTLTIRDAVLENIQASGGANFELSNGVLQGSSSGWNLTNIPTPKDYYWFSDNGVPGDWDDPMRWKLVGTGSSNGCVPSITDNVYVSSASKGNIRIPPDYTAECLNFIWTNKDGLSLTLDGTPSLKSTLKVAGDFILESSSQIIGNNFHKLLFSSTKVNLIITDGVTLPDVKFIGDQGIWNLGSHFTSHEIVFEGGTLVTDDFDITTDYWLSLENNPKNFEFGSSHIKVNGEMSLARPTVNGVTVDAGTSLIECEKFTSKVTDLYEVQLNNSSNRTLDNYNYNFHSLILNGSGTVTVQNDLTLDSLIFKAPNSTLLLNLSQPQGAGDYEFFTVNGQIKSMTDELSPGNLKSANAGDRKYIHKPVGNLCISGPVVIEDIETDVEGVAHSPEGIDNGNNVEIDFTPIQTNQNTPLYWTGKTDSNWAFKSNWSTLSGGCSTNYNPNNRPRLIFDQNSYYENDTVTLQSITSTNEIEFKNVTEELVFDNRVGLTLDEIIMSNSWVQFIGKDYTINNSVTISNGTFIEVLARTMTAGEWIFTNTGTNSLMIVRDGSDIEQVEN